MQTLFLGTPLETIVAAAIFATSTPTHPTLIAIIAGVHLLLRYVIADRITGTGVFRFTCIQL